MLLVRGETRKRSTGNQYRQELRQVWHSCSRIRSRCWFLARAYQTRPWSTRPDHSGQHNGGWVHCSTYLNRKPTLYIECPELGLSNVDIPKRQLLLISLIIELSHKLISNDDSHCLSPSCESSCVCKSNFAGTDCPPDDESLTQTIEYSGGLYRSLSFVPRDGSTSTDLLKWCITAIVSPGA